METIELKKFIKDVGDTVHSMNTIAVALSKLNSANLQIPEGLEISWDPKNIEVSKMLSRNFNARSTYVYVAESLFQYLNNISKNPYWAYESINFKGEEKKAIKVYTFLKSIPLIDERLAILCEFLCHWRNRIVHLDSSNAELSNTKTKKLIESKEYFYNNFHHFDINEGLTNFKEKKITLKDVSTLSTIAIKCVRKIDEYLFEGISQQSATTIVSKIIENRDIKRFISQGDCLKTRRQIGRWVQINFPFLTDKNTI